MKARHKSKKISGADYFTTIPIENKKINVNCNRYDLF